MSTLNLEQVEIIDIVQHVENNIIGRLANRTGTGRTNNTELLLEYVQKAGEGNYLEIGTLFGGSAIAVALLKEELEQSGHVFCIDPLDGYYRKIAPRDDMVDEQSGVPVIPATFYKNLKKFNVQNRVFLLRDYSTNVISFIDMKFTVAYIDGYHWDEVPFLDWNLVRRSITKYIIFDNYDEKHPSVMSAVEQALTDPEWKMCYQEEITCIIERV